MKETGLTLYIDLEQGSRIDLEAAARTSLAWAKTIKSIGVQIDPMTPWHIELESSLPGSQKIRSLIVLPESAEVRGMIKGAIVMSLLFALKTTAGWSFEQVLEYIHGPDAPHETRVMSDKDKEQLALEIVDLLKKEVGKAESLEVFDALEQEENVTGAGVTSSPDRKPMQLVPRASFPEVRPDSDENESEQRVTTDRIELVLIKPNLTNDSKRVWAFQSPYGNFGAPIHDQEFLADFSSGRLNIPMLEGITMVVEIEITEEREGLVWKPVNRVIIKVIDVVVPPIQGGFDLDGPQ